MNYDTVGNADEVTIALKDDLTYKDHEAFNELLEEIDRSGVRKVICDLAELEFIDSSGLGLLLLLKSRCTKSGCEIRITNTVGQVAKLLKYTNTIEQLE